MWKLIGRPVSVGGGPQPIPGRIADVDGEHVDDGAVVAVPSGALELGGGGVGGVARQDASSTTDRGRRR